MKNEGYLKRKIKKPFVKIATIVIIFCIGFVSLIGVGIVTTISNYFVNFELDEIEAEESKGLSSTVIILRPLVEMYCEMWGMNAYENLILAMIQQESSGVGIDVMQCAESGIAVINTQEDSIRVGIQYLSMHFATLGITSPGDEDKIKTALQAYNYGGGFIDYVNENGGNFSTILAKQFQAIKIQEIVEDLVNGGMSREEAEASAGYGDSDYVAHVWRYYASLNAGGAAETVAADMNSPYYHIGLNIFSNAGYTGQCTWYVWGRVNEVNEGAYGGYVLPGGNAAEWYDIATIRQFDVGPYPRSNSIMVWGDVSSGYGHVAYLESYDSETGTVTFTDGNTGNPAADGVYFENHNYTHNVEVAFAYVHSHSMPTSQVYNYPGNGYYLIGYIYL